MEQNFTEVVQRVIDFHEKQHREAGPAHIKPPCFAGSYVNSRPQIRCQIEDFFRFWRENYGNLMRAGPGGTHRHQVKEIRPKFVCPFSPYLAGSLPRLFKLLNSVS